MIPSAILAVLALIQQVIPILGVTGNAVTTITSIITALEKLMPYIVDEIGTVYTAVKNIIAQLQNQKAITPEQLTSLTELDTQVDSAWTAIESKLDPDAQAGG